MWLGRFRWDTGNNSFTQRVVEHGKRLPREGVESPSPEGFKRRVDVAPGDTVSGGVGSARVTMALDHLKGLFQPKQFYDPKTDERPFLESCMTKAALAI